MKRPVIQSENLDQKAYQIVKDMIENRELLPGQKIPQEKLAADLGISRTPLISALKFLEHEKLVKQSLAGDSSYVLFSMEEMVSIFEIREVLEGLSARRAAQSITSIQAAQLEKIFLPFRITRILLTIRPILELTANFTTLLLTSANGNFLVPSCRLST